MKNRIYFVRHGENPANLTKEFSHRRVDYPLTEKGRLQAHQTGEFFRDKEIVAVYSSPLRRARETAEAIAKNLSLEIQVLENFREVNVGYLEDLPVCAELWELHDRIIQDWLNGKPETSFPGGENYFSLWQRMKQGLIESTQDIYGQNLVVVAHGGIFSLPLQDLCPDVNFRQIVQSGYPNCGVSELLLEQNGGRLRGDLQYWASADHLFGEAAELISGVPDQDTFKLD